MLFNIRSIHFSFSSKWSSRHLITMLAHIDSSWGGGWSFHNLEWEPLYGIDEQGSGQSILQDALFLPTPATANVRSVNYSVIYTTASNNHSQGLPSTNKWFQILAIAWYIARRTCPINNTPKLGSWSWSWFVEMVIYFVLIWPHCALDDLLWSDLWLWEWPLWEDLVSDPATGNLYLLYYLICCPVAVMLLYLVLNNLNECCYLDSYREHLCFSAKSLVKTSIYPDWQAGIFSRKAQRLPRLFSSKSPQTSLLSIHSGTRTNINQFFMHLALHCI